MWLQRPLHPSGAACPGGVDLRVTQSAAASAHCLSRPQPCGGCSTAADGSGSGPAWLSANAATRPAQSQRGPQAAGRKQHAAAAKRALRWRAHDAAHAVQIAVATHAPPQTCAHTPQPALASLLTRVRVGKRAGLRAAAAARRVHEACHVQTGAAAGFITHNAAAQRTLHGPCAHMRGLAPTV